MVVPGEMLEADVRWLLCCGGPQWDEAWVDVAMRVLRVSDAIGPEPWRDKVRINVEDLPDHPAPEVEIGPTLDALGIRGFLRENWMQTRGAGR